MSQIIFDNVYKSFGAKKVLNGISFQINKGEIVCLLGSSGSGKSTILREINMLEDYDSGTIKVFDNDLRGIKNVNEYRSKVMMVFQQFNLFNNLSVLDNCTLALRKVKKLSKEESERIAIENLNKVGMNEYINSRVDILSGGQKQRVGIARALSLNPDILLFDEPTSALDPEMVKGILDLIKSIINKDRTMLIVTHEMAFARQVADRIIFVENGKIIEDQKAEDFFNNPKEKRIKEFLSSLE